MNFCVDGALVTFDEAQTVAALGVAGEFDFCLIQPRIQFLVDVYIGDICWERTCEKKQNTFKPEYLYYSSRVKRSLIISPANKNHGHPIAGRLLLPR